jgi:hypothetical protein
MMIYFGNKKLIQNYKIAFLCSRICPADIILKSLDWAKSKKDKGECMISCFHSRIEKDVFDILIKGTQPLILVLARGMKKRWPKEIKKAVKQERLLIVSPFDETLTHITTVLFCVFHNKPAPKLSYFYSTCSNLLRIKISAHFFAKNRSTYIIKSIRCRYLSF